MLGLLDISSWENNRWRRLGHLRKNRLKHKALPTEENQLRQIISILGILLLQFAPLFNAEAGEKELQERIQEMVVQDQKEHKKGVGSLFDVYSAFIGDGICIILNYA